LCPPEAATLTVRAVIHWDAQPAQTKPAQMRIHLFGDNGGVTRADRSADGGEIYVPMDVAQTPYCYDYYGDEEILFRGEDNHDEFAAYHQPLTNSRLRSVPNEPTVAEPRMSAFYAARAACDELLLESENIVADSIHEIHFYPENYLHEFTFCITDVPDARRIRSLQGSMSGMADALNIQTLSPSSQAATIVFDRISVHGDSIKGAFRSFGPADLNVNVNQLRIEALTTDGSYVEGTWGYAFDGEDEETLVRDQLASAWGTNGDAATQAAWRARNGGFDILLTNDDRFIVPPPAENNGNSSGGGFDVGVSEYYEEEVFL
jgi:hypothetical protein